MQTKNSYLMKWMKVLQIGRKHCGERRNCSLRAISPLSTVFSKDLYYRHVKTRACLGKGQKHFAGDKKIVDQMIESCCCCCCCCCCCLKTEKNVEKLTKSSFQAFSMCVITFFSFSDNIFKKPSSPVSIKLGIIYKRLNLFI